MAGVHPALKARVKWILAIASRYGVKAEITSGYRTYAQQERLYRHPEGYPVSPPGCSSHEFGLAVDIVADSQAGQQFLIALARYLGLYVPSNDPIHFALFTPELAQHLLPASCLPRRGTQVSPEPQNRNGGDPGEPQNLEPRRFVEFLTPAAARTTIIGLGTEIPRARRI